MLLHDGQCTLYAMGISSDISYISFLCFSCVIFFSLSVSLLLFLSPYSLSVSDFLSPLLSNISGYLSVDLSMLHCRRMTYFSVTASLQIAEELWHPRGRRTRFADVFYHSRITVQYYIRYLTKNSTV